MAIQNPTDTQIRLYKEAEQRMREARKSLKQLYDTTGEKDADLEAATMNLIASHIALRTGMPSEQPFTEAELESFRENIVPWVGVRDMVKA